MTRLPRFQPNDHFVGRFGPPGRRRDRARLHVNVVHHPGIVRHDVEEVSRLLQGADDRVVGALQNPDDAAFGAIAPAASAGVIGITRDPRNDAVAVHRRASIFGRNKNVALVGTFAGEKCKASLMDLQLSGDEVRRLRKDVAILADAGDLAGALQLTQRFLQSAPILALESECAGELGQVERPVFRRAQEREDLCI